MHGGYMTCVGLHSERGVGLVRMKQAEGIANMERVGLSALRRLAAYSTRRRAELLKHKRIWIAREGRQAELAARACCVLDGCEGSSAQDELSALHGYAQGGVVHARANQHPRI